MTAFSIASRAHRRASWRVLGWPAFLAYPAALPPALVRLQWCSEAQRNRRATPRRGERLAAWQECLSRHTPKGKAETERLRDKLLGMLAEARLGFGVSLVDAVVNSAADRMLRRAFRPAQGEA